MFIRMGEKSFKIANAVFKWKAKTIFKNSKSKISFDNKECPLTEVLKSKDSRLIFREFLMREYSDENLDFWMDVEQYKTHKKGKKSAFDIFREYVDQDAPREINIDRQTREDIRSKLNECGNTLFDEAQTQIFFLMNNDSFPRFLSRLTDSR